jgi:hypothetical protein
MCVTGCGLAADARPTGHALASGAGVTATVIMSEGQGISMYPDSALSAGQLAIMAVTVSAALAVWLILVFLAARGPSGNSAAMNGERHGGGAGASVTRLPAGAKTGGKAAA